MRICRILPVFIVLAAASVALRASGDEPKAEDGLLEVVLDEKSGVKMAFVKIKAGTFVMGSNDGEEDEKPVHEVTLTRDYWMGETEVTQRQWEALMGANPSEWKGAELPVESVSWEDCQEFVKKLNERLKGKVAGLPTEAEWEYACRAGGKGKWCFGDDEANLGEHAWYDRNSDSKTHAVRGKEANAWGLYDMHGNVWEWCEDWYGPYGGKATDPKGPGTGDGRILRGGNWIIVATSARSACRHWDLPDSRISLIGFRVALRDP